MEFNAWLFRTLVAEWIAAIPFILLLINLWGTEPMLIPVPIQWAVAFVVVVWVAEWAVLRVGGHDVSLVPGRKHTFSSSSPATGQSDEPRGDINEELFG